MTTYDYCIFNHESPEYSECDDVDEEPCRLSWFIIKNNNDTAAQNNTTNEFKIVHAMDITKPAYANIFLNNNTVLYNTKKEKLIGKVVAAADNIEIIRENLKALESAVETPSTVNRYCLVQYCQTPQRLIHRILQQNELIEFQTSYNNYKEIFIRDGRKLYRGYMLLCDENKDNLQYELAKLKEKCSNVIRSSLKENLNVEEDARLEPEANTWLLLQHSENIFDAIYSIMRYDNTYMLKGNMYPGLQAYFGNGNITYQAVILHKSHDEAQLVSALQTIINSCCMPIAHT